MKLMKKIIPVFKILLPITFLIMLGFNENLNKVDAATINVNSTKVKLRLNHNSYVYNKNGKRLKTYKGKKAFIKKSKTLTIKGKIEEISTAKRYYFYGENSKGKITPYWLVYKKIEGNYYYSIGNKGYIKCINVRSVNGTDNRLIASQATVTVKPLLGKVAYAEDSAGKSTTKTFKSGKKLIIDNTDILGNNTDYSYHIKGTNYWINARDLKANPRPSNTVTSKLNFY